MYLIFSSSFPGVCMLRTLSIRHFVTIDSLDIDFKPGFSVIVFFFYFFAIKVLRHSVPCKDDKIKAKYYRRLSPRFLKGDKS